jgi:hypothetical protein
MSKDKVSVTVRTKEKGVQTIEIPVKTSFRKEQTLNIKFVLTRPVLIHLDGSLLIDSVGWCIRDYDTGVMMARDKTQKALISKFFIMLDHHKFMDYYNTRIASEKIK